MGSRSAEWHLATIFGSVLKNSKKQRYAVFLYNNSIVFYTGRTSRSNAILFSISNCSLLSRLFARKSQYSTLLSSDVTVLLLQVDVAILEVGIGGTYDCTNIVR